MQVPVTFDAEAVATPAGIVCGTPGIGNCTSAAECTRSMGFYRDNPEVVNPLITAALRCQMICYTLGGKLPPKLEGGFPTQNKQRKVVVPSLIAL